MWYSRDYHWIGRTSEPMRAHVNDRTNEADHSQVHRFVIVLILINKSNRKVKLYKEN